MLAAIRAFFQSIQEQADSYEMRVSPVRYGSVEQAFEHGCDQSMAFGALTRGVGAAATAVAIQHNAEVLSRMV